MQKYLAIFLAVLGCGFTGCSSSGDKQWDDDAVISAAFGDKQSNDAVISARAAIGELEETFSNPLFEGDGAKGLRLAILAPEVRGTTPEYLPVYVQGLLNNNFKKYSAITLIDRQNLEKIIAEQELAASGRFSEKDYVAIGNLTNAQYYVLGVIQKVSGEEYSLQLTVTNATTGEPKATFIKTGTLAQLEGTGALINEATADLLTQLGVQLTPAGTLSLLAGNRSAVRSETGLAKGITAQASGDSVEALLQYAQSITFDASQIETLTRFGMVSSAISSGSISRRIRNDIEARDRWLKAFQEAVLFFKEHPPFELTFDPKLIQEGTTDYKKRTANLAMRIALDPSEAGFAALNALLEGLEQTKKRQDWGFNGWPLLELTPKVPGTVVFEGKRRFGFKIDVALVSEDRKVLGVSSINLETGTLRFAAGERELSPPDGSAGLVRFPRVRADDLTSVLRIVITGVNGIPAHDLNVQGYMRISPGDLEGKPVFRASRSGRPADMVWIEGGTFMMGSPAFEVGRDGDEGPRHKVRVSSFYMGKYEVTQKEYQELMGTNPSHFKGDNLPVECVSWFDAIAYCNARSRKEGLTPAYTVNGTSVSWNRSANGYRLPTEAEWEYACRAGTVTPYSSGIFVGSAGWYWNNSGGKTHPVGEKKANAWGLYDMHGNVWEWCWDWFGSYSSGAQTDPLGASSGSLRVLRGGGWGLSGLHLRSAYRNYINPSSRFDYLGFRLLRP